MFLKFLFAFFFILENIYGFHDHGVMMNRNGVRGKANEVIKIEMIYETLCPYSKIHYTDQFKKAVLELGQYLDVNTYPYGNAKTKVDENGNITITCQHGPRECYGNMLHACAIDSLKNITAAVIFNSCLMNREMSNGMSNDTTVDECGQFYEVDTQYVKTCAKSEKGFQLLKHYGELSRKYQYEGVPVVFINGVLFMFSDEYKYFKGEICKAFNNPPPECS